MPRMPGRPRRPARPARSDGCGQPGRTRRPAPQPVGAAPISTLIKRSPWCRSGVIPALVRCDHQPQEPHPPRPRHSRSCALRPEGRSGHGLACMGRVAPAYSLGLLDPAQSHRRHHRRAGVAPAYSLGLLERPRIGESRLCRSGVIPALVRCAHGPLGPRPRPYDPDWPAYSLGLLDQGFRLFLDSACNDAQEWEVLPSCHML